MLRLLRSIMLLAAGTVLLSLVNGNPALAQTTSNTPDSTPRELPAGPQAQIHVVLQTNFGDLLIRLRPDRAPLTVANFLRYLDAGAYDNSLIHRIVPHYIIQGGGFSADLAPLATEDPIPNESDNGLQNRSGTIAMARETDPHSARSQFFINLEDNLGLDHPGASRPNAWGYTVFGEVVDGFDNLERMRQLKTMENGPFAALPVDPVVIERARRATLTPVLADQQ